MSDSKTLTKADLYQFTGSEHWYIHALNPKVVFTDGAKYVADHGGAYWLLDTIALAQRTEKKVASTRFQLWTLKVNADRTATLTCVKGDCKPVYTQELEFTDFPLAEIKFYFTNNTIYLPSEH